LELAYLHTYVYPLLRIFPVDLIKTRLQNFSANETTSALKMTKAVIGAEGFRGLYRGLLANLVGVTPEKAIKLVANDYFRSIFSKGQPQENIPVHLGMLSGALAGLAQVIATNPMETVKIRMQMATATIEGHAVRKPSTVKVVRDLGLRGLYKGSTATLSRDIPFSMIFFQLSSTLKENFSRNVDSETIDFKYIFASSLIAGTVAAYVVTPMDGKQKIKNRKSSEILKL
jgi:hypothetical protein